MIVNLTPDGSGLGSRNSTGWLGAILYTPGALISGWLAGASPDVELLASESGIQGRPPLPVVAAVDTLLNVPALLGLATLGLGIRFDVARSEVATGLGPAGVAGDATDSGELSLE